MKKPLTRVEIYTDGACSGNPGPGGWAAVLKSGDHEKELSGYEDRTTNNRMELTAVIRALQALKRPCEVTIYSDSAYLVNAIQKGWLKTWKEHGWKRGRKKDEPVQNADLWQELDRLLQIHRVQFQKVEAHADDRQNIRVDQLAVQEIKKHKKRNGS